MSLLEININTDGLAKLAELLENPPGCDLSWDEEIQHLDDHTVNDWANTVVAELRKLTHNLPSVHATVLKLGQWWTQSKDEYPAFYNKAFRIYKQLTK